MKAHKGQAKDRKAAAQLAKTYGAALVGRLGHPDRARAALMGYRHPVVAARCGDVGRLLEIAFSGQSPEWRVEIEAEGGR